MKKLWKSLLILLPVMVLAVTFLCLGLTSTDKESVNRGVNAAGETSSYEPIYPAQSGQISEMGGAIYLEPNTEYIMTGGTISNHSNKYGGAIFVAKGATFTMSGGTIKNCNATYGGGIYVQAGAKCTITGGEITGCSATQEGPAIFVEKGATFSCTSPDINEDEIQNYNFNLGVIPNGVEVYRSGVKLANYAPLESGDVLNIMNNTLSLTTNDLYIGDMSVNGAERIGGNDLYRVYSSVKITIEQLPATLDKLKFTLKTDHYEVAMSSSSITGEVVIPNYHENLPVTVVASSGFKNASKITSVKTARTITNIGDAAFEYCYGLTKVEIPNSVTSIGSWAFGSCGSLTNITLGSGVTSIENSAFSNCSKLTSITLPNGLQTIGNNAFYSAGLTSINIPESVTSIGGGAFPGKLISIMVSKGNTTYTSRDNNGSERNCIIRISDKTMIRACNDTIIPDDGSVTSLYYAYHYCSKLTSITIPNTITSIGGYAFGYCSGLTKVEIPNSVTSIGSEAFWFCSSLANVTLGSSVKSIGSGAFSGCRKLTSITLPNGLQTIGNTAFYSTGLTSINIPESVTSIGMTAFDGDLTSIIVAQDNTAYTSRDNSGKERNCIIRIKDKTMIMACNDTTIPDDGSVTSLDHAYYKCTKLTSITIPSTITSIGGSAFESCSGLTKVEIPNSVTSIGSSAFYGCSKLAKVYYNGTKTEWEALVPNIKSSNTYLTNAARYYYSASNPYLTNPSDTDLYWYYSGGIPVEWSK